MTNASKSDIKTIVLLDSHAILHRGYHALPEFATSSGQPTGALYGLSIMLVGLIEKFKPDYIFAAYDLPEKTFRHKVYDNYKAGRKKLDKALIDQLAEAPNLFDAFNIPVYKMPGFEADDMIGTICEKLKSQKNIHIIIASGDMDTLQLVDGDKVRVYTLKKGLKDTIVYNEKAVVERFGFSPVQIPDYKGLRGDPSDNIIGIAGIGEKTATVLIQKFGTIQKMYESLDKDGEKKFKEAGITDRIFGLIKENRDEALFSKELATITLDAPVEVELPEKEISDTINIEKVEEYFKKLEFRSLGQKVKMAITKIKLHDAGINYEEAEKTLEKNKKEGNGEGDKKKGTEAKIKKAKKPKTDKSADMTLFEGEIEALKEAEDANEVRSEPFKKAAIGMWLLDSNTYYPSDTEVLDYAKAETAEQAEKNIEDRIKINNLLHVYENIELPLIPIIDEMEKRGVLIDIAYLEKLSKNYHKQLQDLEKNIFRLAKKEFNVASPKQLGEVLFDDLGLNVKGLKKTAGGARSTKESELEKLREEHEIIPMILEHRELSKLLGTYIDTIPGKVDKNHRLHTHFVQAGTTTGRMASINPNLQNIPVKTERGKAIRNAFIPGKGMALIGIDYSQFELRIAAFLSGDEKLIEIFKRGDDVHAAVASEVFQVPLKEVTSDMRRKAKVINFGILYGMGVNALKQNLGGSRDEAKQFYDAYFNRFTTLASYLEDVKAKTAVQGYTETFFKRKRFFPGIKSALPFIRASAERMAINAPIQGTQADLVKIAMKKVDNLFNEMKLRGKAELLLQVHDELVYEINEKEIEKLLPKIKEAMEDVMDEKDRLGVPIVVNIMRGENWGSMAKVL